MQVRSNRFAPLALSLLAMAAGLSPAALALTPEQEAAARAYTDRIQREEQLRQQKQFEQNRKSKRAPTRIEVEAPQAVEAGKSAVCRQIDTITLAGADSLGPRQQRALLKPFQASCMGVKEIESLLSEITRVYINKGMIASRAYVPAQDLTKGQLQILVVEGQVSGLLLAPAPGESGPAPEMRLGNLFPGVIGKPLNLRDFEQGLDQINRLSSNNATMDIRPGAAPGESVVAIQNSPTQRWHGNFGADNQGTESTGREQAALTGSVDDLLGLNEYISITRRQAVPDRDGQGSSSENYSFNLPYGYSLLSYGHSDTRYESTVQLPSGLEEQSAGDSRTDFLRLDHVAWRNQDSRLNLSAMLTRKEFNNFFAGQWLEVASRKLAVADLGLSFSTELLGGYANLDLGYSRGLNDFDALVDADDLPGYAPHAQFEKYTYGLGYSHPFVLAGRNGLFSSQLVGQHALDALYGSEQISIGGIYSVRGFYDGSLAGDDGYYLRNELSLMQPLGQVFGRSATFKPYIALDGGKVQSIAPDTPEGTLVGGAVGFTVTTGSLLFDTFIGHPLRDRDYLPEEGSTAFARLSYSF